MEKQGTTIQVKQNIRPSKLIKDLADLGYQNVQIATPAKEGEFARRGNLIDIWLERYKMPVRIDLIGETIENIYLFNYLTQQKIKNLKEVYIVPFGVTPKIAPAWTRKKAFPSSGGKYERLFLSEIAPGDLVVHIDHGIGRFVDINQTSLGDQRFVSASNPRESNISNNQGSSALVPTTPQKSNRLAALRQYLVIEYAKGD